MGYIASAFRQPMRRVLKYSIPPRVNDRFAEDLPVAPRRYLGQRLSATPGRVPHEQRDRQGLFGQFHRGRVTRVDLENRRLLAVRDEIDPVQTDQAKRLSQTCGQQVQA